MSVIINNEEYAVIAVEEGGTYFKGEQEYEKGFDKAYTLEDENNNNYRLLIIDDCWYLWPLDLRYNPPFYRRIGMLLACGQNKDNELKWEGALNEATWL